jgi:hypothetical protein
MTNELHEQEIARFIESQVKAYPGIPGAKLGALATAQFPGVSFRYQFDGLKNFVRRFCGPRVEVILGGPGGDDTYRWTETAPLDQTTAKISPTADIIDRPWAAFASSDSPSKLRVNRDSGELDVVAPSEVVDAPWIEVSKVTTEEYRQMASAFLPQISDADRVHFSGFLHLPDFWDRWFAETRSFAGGKYFRAWVSFRFHTLCEIFLERLQKLGVPEELQPLVLGRLKQSKMPKQLLRNKEESLQFSTERSSALRQMALMAVKTMTEEDLRRVWLPLGVVSDALRRSNH